jgi:hypothetical protein
MSKPSFALVEPYSLSLTSMEMGDFILVSRSRGKREELMFLGFCKPRRSFNALKEDLIDLVAEYSPLDAAEVRSRLTLEEKQAMTWHLIQVLHNRIGASLSPRETLVSQYKLLLSWGESAAAKVLAELEGVSVRTMHSRLRLARDRGLLDSPGSGSRLGQD